MKYALVVVEKPKSGAGLWQRDWSSFVTETDSIQPITKESLKCSENTWLFSVENDTAVLAKILTVAQGRQFPYRVFYFSRDPIEYTYDPTS